MTFAETIPAELERTVQRLPHVPAFHFRGRDYTYREWAEASRRFARALLARGLGRGDRVALVLPTVPEYMFCYLGAARIGAITTGISTRYRRHEIRHILANADPRLIVTTAGQGEVDFPGLIEESRGQAQSLEEIVRFEGEGPGTLAGLLAAGDSARVDLEAAEDAVALEDPLAIIYTSGTTGSPKGAVYDSRAMIALTRLFQSRLAAAPAPGSPSFWPGVSLTHVGATGRVHLQIWSAATLVLHDYFDSRWMIDQILRLEPPTIGGFPPVLMMMMRSPEFAPGGFPFVKAVNFGGAPLAPHLVEEIKAKLGVEVYTGYSCTESLIISATLPSDPPGKRVATVGRPTPGVELRIVDAEGRDLPAGGEGRVAVRSPATMRGYWRNPEATAAALDGDGWLYNGDVGTLDADGYLRLLGREKEMYFRAAFNVYPGEIEAVLHQHPKVLQAAVVGVKDDVLGEMGRAFVVPADPENPPTLEELRAHVGSELASYKRPDALTILGEMPLNAMLKVDKLALRRMVEP